MTDTPIHNPCADCGAHAGEPCGPDCLCSGCTGLHCDPDYPCDACLADRKAAAMDARPENWRDGAGKD